MRRIGLRFLSSFSRDDVAERLATYRKLLVVSAAQRCAAKYPLTARTYLVQFAM